MGIGLIGKLEKERGSGRGGVGGEKGGVHKMAGRKQLQIDKYHLTRKSIN